MKTSQLIVLALASITLMTNVACQVDLQAVDDNAVFDDNGNPVKLDGIWETGCIADPNSSAYMEGKLQFSDKDVKSEMKVFNDSTCSQVFYTDTAEGTFKVGVKSANLPGAYEVDYSLTFADGRKATYYDIVKIEGDTMFLGTYKGMNPQSRPISVDRSIGYKKTGN